MVIQITTKKRKGQNVLFYCFTWAAMAVTWLLAWIKFLYKDLGGKGAMTSVLPPQYLDFLSGESSSLFTVKVFVDISSSSSLPPWPDGWEGRKQVSGRHSRVSTVSLSGYVTGRMLPQTLH